MFVHPHPKYARKNNHTPYALTRTTATRHYLQTHGACVDGHTRHTHHIRHMCKPAARVRGRRRPATTAAVLDREGHAWFRTSSPPSPGYCICGGGSGGGGVDPFPNDPRHKNVEGLEKTRNQEIHKSSPSPAYKIFGSGGYGPSLGSERGGWPGLPHLCKTDGHLTPWPPRRGLPDRRWWRT